MIPLLPFIAGLAVGAAAIATLRSERARSALNETGTRLRSAANTAESSVRSAAQSGLALLRSTSAGTPAKAKRTARKSTVTKPAAPKRAPRQPKAPKAEA